MSMQSALWDTPLPERVGAPISRRGLMALARDSGKVSMGVDGRRVPGLGWLDRAWVRDSVPTTAEAMVVANVPEDELHTSVWLRVDFPDGRVGRAWVTVRRSKLAEAMAMA